MIPVDSLLYKIDLKLNKLSTEDHQRIQLEDKILALNEAQIELIKTRQSKYDDIDNLIESYEDHPLSLTLINTQLNKWIVSLSTIVPVFMFYVDAYVLADKGICKNKKIWINRELINYGDIQFILNNVHYKPSFEYQETFISISSDEIAIFTDGTFIPTKLYLSYIRYPLYIDKAGYVKLDGNNSITQDSELDEYLEAELVDLTVKALAMYTENAGAMNTAQARIQTNK